MRRAGPQLRPFVLCACLALAGCGKTEQAGPLTFETLPDTAGLSAGGPILEGFEAYRIAGGALRVKGVANLPDGTRLQVAIRRPRERAALAMVQVAVRERRFDSPPMMADYGPLPEATYRFEVSAQFTPAWQPAAVLRATDEGRMLRGPGVTRTRLGWAAFSLVEEMKR